MTVLTKRLHSDFPLGLTGPFESLFTEFDSFPRAFSPTYEIVKGEDHYRVLLEVPGVKKEDIHLSLEGGYLTVTGEKKQVEENAHSSTRAYSSFKESFKLSDDIDEENVSAKLEDGVLEVTLKRATKKEKRIEIL